MANTATINELKGRRANLVDQARAITNAAGDSGLSEVKSQEFDGLMDNVDQLKAEIDRLQAEDDADGGANSEDWKRLVS